MSRKRTHSPLANFVIDKVLPFFTLVGYAYLNYKIVLPLFTFGLIIWFIKSKEIKMLMNEKLITDKSQFFCLCSFALVSILSIFIQPLNEVLILNIFSHTIAAFFAIIFIAVQIELSLFKVIFTSPLLLIYSKQIQKNK